MAYGSSYSPGGGALGFNVTPMVKRLLIVNGAVFLVAFLALAFGQGRAVTDLLAFSPGRIFVRPWTLVTYAFLHFAPFHLFFNLLVLFFFGPPLEERWGAIPFLKFYLASAAGGALLSFMQPSAYVLGASGAVYGVMLAFALYWPNMAVYVFGIFPVKAKYLVGAMAVMSVLFIMTPRGDGIAHWAHLGGFVSAFLWLKSPWGPSPWGEVPSRGRKKGGGGLAALLQRRPSASRSVKPVPKATAAVNQKPPRDARAERDLLDDVDRILDKISEQGMGSLTAEERKRLDEVSRKRRTN